MSSRKWRRSPVYLEDGAMLDAMGDMDADMDADADVGETGDEE